MKFGLNTLLPKIFSERWKQLMLVVDSILGDLQKELIEPILNQHNIETSTNLELIDSIRYFGYNVISLEGFTSTKEYLIRQYVTLGSRLKTRNLRNSYDSILKIYFQTGTMFPLYYDSVQRIYIPFETWWTFLENLKITDNLDAEKDNLLYYIPTFLDDYTFFDSGFIFDYDVAVYSIPQKTGVPKGYLDTPEIIQTLDQFHEVQYISRYIYVQMVCRKLLTDNCFLDFNEMSALLYDLNNLHRPTEVLYFFPKVSLYTKNDNTETNISIEKYDKSSTKEIKSIRLSGTLEDVQSIRYGTGYATNLVGISSLINETKIYSILNVYIKEKTPISFNFFPKIIPNVKAFSFSEIGLYNVYNELIYYACFPSIIFPDNINGGNEILIKLETEQNITEFYTHL